MWQNKDKEGGYIYELYGVLEQSLIKLSYKRNEYNNTIGYTTLTNVFDKRNDTEWY